MTKYQLRLFARRHAFAGYTVHHMEEQTNRIVCTRYHCIDWNFVGRPRVRPNKWYVEMQPGNTNTWKEWSFAKYFHDQLYYWERWERLDGDELRTEVVLSLRKSQVNKDGMRSNDGVIVVVGDHFSIIQGRYVDESRRSENTDKTNLVDLVDAALEVDDRETAESYLSINAAHGRVSPGWIIDCAIYFWCEGTRLFDAANVSVIGDDMNSCRIIIYDTVWQVYESSIQDTKELEAFLKGSYPFLPSSYNNI